MCPLERMPHLPLYIVLQHHLQVPAGAGDWKSMTYSLVVRLTILLHMVLGLVTLIAEDMIGSPLLSLTSTEESVQRKEIVLRAEKDQ
ncbi:UNVERIFIED_CONTAM: hypothetical protein PYX00_010161 [Menopon gallinae]|uniref:Succinate dehydrogenase subunit 4 n=1 Tax=Menopon gallinae TaxID=328185 RepID=A0AAW2HEA5_9NEOP